jgi:hypothetical protein
MRIPRSEKSATATWPPKYRAQFWSHGRLAYRVAAVQFSVGVLKSPANLLSALGVLLAAVGAAILLGAISGFPAYWPVFVVVALLVIIAGGSSAILAYPHRSQMFDRYRPGTKSQIFVAKGMLEISLNSHLFIHEIAEVKRVWRFGDLSAIEFTDNRSVVVPTPFVPHWTKAGDGPEISPRWGKSGR